MFGRADVDRFLDELTDEEYAEQVAYEIATQEIQKQAHAEQMRELARKGRR